MEFESEITPKAKKLDALSLVMAIATCLLLAAIAYRRIGPSAPAEPPSVGSVPPNLRLLDPETEEPVVLLGLRGKVVWISFLAVGSKSAGADYFELGKVWKRLHPHQKFAMAVVSASNQEGEAVRKLVDESPEHVPTYLSAPETAQAFGIGDRNLPFHLILDPAGKVAAIARGGGAATIARLEAKASKWLEEIEPNGRTRFAKLLNRVEPPTLIQPTPDQLPVSWSRPQPDRDVEGLGSSHEVAVAKP